MVQGCLTKGVECWTRIQFGTLTATWEDKPKALREGETMVASTGAHLLLQGIDGALYKTIPTGVAIIFTSNHIRGCIAIPVMVLRISLLHTWSALLTLSPGSFCPPYLSQSLHVPVYPVSAHASLPKRCRRRCSNLFLPAFANIVHCVPSSSLQ